MFKQPTNDATNLSPRLGLGSIGRLCLTYGFVAALSLLLRPAPALAQAFPIPTELSAGLGPVIDRDPRQSSVDVNLGLAFVYVRDQWLEPAFEMGLGPTSDAAPCRDQGGPLALPETCADVYFLAGVRFRPLRESDRVHRPFVHFLAGGYWKGTGLKEPEFQASDPAVQMGGGIDIRRPGSIHGLRVSGDYRHVFAGEQSRQQLQFVVSYFVGWRGE
jgi:hypothetical protein